MKNKQLQIAKDTIAKKYGFKDFKHAIGGDYVMCGISQKLMPDFMDSVAIEYHRLMSEWVSVDERLPEINEEYLLRCYQAEGFDQYYHKVGYWDNDRFNLDESHVADDLDNPIRFWMPLPQPPK